MPPASEASRFAANGGIRLHYVVAGAGPPLLLLHGIPDFWNGWRRQIEALHGRHRVAAMGLRGFNLSDKPADVAYYLASHPEIATQLAQETWTHDALAHGPMKRLLDSFLVASATPSPSTAQHAADTKTGSALALVPPPQAPKPPNPVRTQAPVSADSDQPGDDASLEDHERYFHKGGRRRR